MRQRFPTFVIAALSIMLLSACGSDDKPASGGEVKADTVGGDGTLGEVTEDIGTEDTAVETDSAETDTAVADTTVEDTTPADVGGCPGGDGCACTGNGDCGSGACLDTHEGKKCAQKCTDTCSAGYACKDIGDGEPLFYCVSTLISLCSPCKFHSECQVQGVGSLCLDYGAEGKFCGSPCSADTDCPSDYTCADATDGAGATSKQCRRKADAGTCGCSDWATTKGLETECAATNEFGTCKATRKCGASGLSACAAKTPASEVCNQQDDDCDGATDNLAADLGCTIKAYLDEGSKVDCQSDNDCKTTGEGCNPSSNKCQTLIGACPGTPTCTADGKLECKGAKTPSVETCNGEDDNCNGVKDEGFSFTSAAGASLAIGAACGDGACAGGTVVCADASTAACSTSNKSAKETCDGTDEDCNGKVDDGSCDDGDACTIDACDSSSKSCSNKPGADCDDKDPCTIDSCDKSKGECVHTGTTGSCDDGDDCTVGDECVVANDGKSSCVAGKGAKDCDDANPCTDDSCDKATGCKHAPNSGQVECYNGAANTAGVGLCKKGKQFCQDGKMLDKCEGEVVPAKSEACDSKDDDCDGLTDEGCTPTNVAVTFAGARVAGTTGNMTIEMLIGRGAPAGVSKGASGSKYDVEFGFYGWLKALLK